MIIKNFSYDETVEMANEDIKVIKEDILPMLKNQNAFSFADIDLIATAFLNVGSRMNIFSKVDKPEAKKLYSEYSALVKEMFSLIEEKEELENE